MSMLTGAAKRVRAASPALVASVMQVLSWLALAVTIYFAWGFRWAAACFFLLLHWYCEHRAHLLYPQPIDMVINCPACGAQHVDKPDVGRRWLNPPHRSHLCHACGSIFRTANVPTNGVACVSSRGESDTWPA